MSYDYHLYASSSVNRLHPLVVTGGSFYFCYILFIFLAKLFV